jgi:hypothetical protein
MSEFGEGNHSGATGGQPRSRSWSLPQNAISIFVLGLLAYYAIFRLPFRFPPRQQLWSASYAFGFNNGIAVVCLAGLLGLVGMVYSARNRPLRQPIDFAVVPTGSFNGSLKVTLGVMALVYLGLTVALYLYNSRTAPPLMWETRHFIHRAMLMELYGLRPYTDFQAEYGPLLTATPVYVHWLLQPLGASLEQAYFASHLLLNVAGLWCIYYVLSLAKMPAKAKIVAFVVLGIAGFAPYMGLNGVLLRYLAPYAGLLLGSRLLTQLLSSGIGPVRSWLCSVLTILSLIAINVILSPEAAVAFAIAWLAYGLLVLPSDRRILLVSAVALAVAGVLCWLSLPTPYYGSVLRFSAGANNLPLLPVPHLLLYIGTLFILVPPLLAVGVRKAAPGKASSGAICGALGILCVVMAPGALGRCDLPHVLFFGMGASMLLMVFLANMSNRAFTSYLAAYAIVFILLMGLVNLNVFFGIHPRALLSPHGIVRLVAQLRSTTGTERPSVAALAPLDRYPHLGLPFATFGDPAVETYVWAHKRLQPEYYVSVVGVYTSMALERKLQDVSKMEYILVPKRLITVKSSNACGDYLKSIRQWFLYRPKLLCRATGLDPNAALREFIAAHYLRVEEVGTWVVLRRAQNLSGFANR